MWTAAAGVGKSCLLLRFADDTYTESWWPVRLVNSCGMMGVGLGQLSQSVAEPFRLMNIFSKNVRYVFNDMNHFERIQCCLFSHIYILLYYISYILYISFTFTIYTYFSYCNSSRSLTYIVTFMKKGV